MALNPDSFVGVNAPAHIAALEALYAVVNPDKLSQVPLMWEKFGPGIWEALVPKYPTVSSVPLSHASACACGRVQCGYKRTTAQLCLRFPPFSWKQVDLTQYAPPPLTEETFDGVTMEEHLAALEQFYAAVNPERMASVCVSTKLTAFSQPPRPALPPLP